MVNGLCFKQENCFLLPIAKNTQVQFCVGFELSYLNLFTELGQLTYFCSFSVNINDRIYKLMDAALNTQPWKN